MGKTREHDQLRASASMWGARRRMLLATAWLSLSAACGSDEETPRVLPPLPDGAVLAESGVPDPITVPPPVVQPPPQQMVDASTTLDAGPPREAGASTSDGGTAPGLDASAPQDAATQSDADAAPSSSDGGGTALGDAGNANPCGSGAEPLAANIRLTELSIYQTVKIPLYRSGAWVATRNASVVQGKKSMLRAFVTPQTGFAARTLRGVLTLDTDGVKTQLISTRMISSASTEEALASTFEFQLDGVLLKGSTQISVGVLENTCMPAATNPEARLPASGGQALNAEAINKLSVVVVPITLGGRVPDTSQAQLEKIKAGFLAIYPVAEVEVSAHAPVSTTITARADGGGWSEILNVVGRTRSTDAPAANVYYYGIMLPAASFQTYCRTGCVLGLAPLATRVSRASQIGLGVGFVDNETITTAVHEIGHAHGLPHAPCSRGGSIQGADTAFPYSGAKIGSWGWDSRSNKLLSPATYVDLMSYCTPEWISDYNYRKLVTRSKAVNTVARIFNAGPAQSWHGIILHPDGSARWSGFISDDAPGELSEARVLDAHGATLTKIEVARVALSHTPDSFVYLPQPGARWAAIDLGDRVIELSSVAAAVE